MSDRDLVLAFQAGDSDAYDELYRRFHDRVARICYRFLNNSTDAEEASQETFLKAFQALHRFNGQYQVGAWLARIASNVCVDHLRVTSRTHLVSLPTEPAVTEQSPEEMLVGEHPRVDVAIKDIQPLHAHALKMRAVEGLSHVEMAGRLDMTAPQVKALLHRARTSFKKAWDKAQGWLVLPIFGSRSIDRSSHMSHAPTNLAMFSAQAPALAEKAAAAAVIVMVAMSGLPSTPSTSANIDAALPGVKAERVTKPARDLDKGSAAAAAPPEATGEEEVVLALPEIVESTLKGSERVNDDDGYGGTGGGGEGKVIPPTAKQTHKKAKETVVNVLESIDS